MAIKWYINSSKKGQKKLHRQSWKIVLKILKLCMGMVHKMKKKIEERKKEIRKKKRKKENIISC